MTITKALYLLLSLTAGASAIPLFEDGTFPPLNIDQSMTSVSGLSSGAYMAVQYHVVNSEQVMGSAIFAGGPYHCAKGDMMTALTTCMNAGRPVDVDPFIDITMQRSSAGKIDNPKNMENDRVFLLSGNLDNTVKPVVVDSLYQYFQSFVKKENIIYDDKHSFAHTQPTNDPNNRTPCDRSVSPYVSNCEYDGAGEAFKHIYGSDLNAPAAWGTETAHGSVVEFSQSGFISSGKGVAPKGFLYVPNSCRDGKLCKLHISFHGCKQDHAQISNAYILGAGYSRWAATNDIVVLYPQADTTPMGQNPNGCWDWWGYNRNPDTYDHKQGAQMAAIRAMVDELIGEGSLISPPSGITPSAVTETSVTLQWGAVSGANAYRVYRDAVKLTDVSGVEYQDASVQSGSVYTYSVSSVDVSGREGPRSADVSVTTPGNPPPVAAPTQLAAKSVSKDSVTLTWKVSSGSVGSHVYRDGNKLTATPVATATFTDSQLQPETEYSYAVTALSSDGSESGLSGSVTVRTQPAFQCEEYTASNFEHVTARRAVMRVGMTYALGSDQPMGLYNVIQVTKLAQTSAGYYIVGNCPTQE